MLHAVTMTLVGLKVALLEDWSLRDIVAGRNELVSAFLALELAYLFQVCREATCRWRSVGCCRNQAFTMMCKKLLAYI